LSADFLTQLEIKIDTLIAKVQTLKEEKAKLAEEVELEKGKNRDAESGTQALANECESLRKSNEEKQNKLDSAAEKIQGLLSKLESVA
jgi:FtsZ-binding cell division protein ZapB